MRTLKSSGTVAPSSRHLARKMLEDVDFSQDMILVELGLGNGVITEQIVSRMSPNSRLYGFEINPEFYAQCQAKFADDPRVTILSASALELDEVLAGYGVDSVDHVISSLPIALFRKEDTTQLFSRLHKLIREGGRYVQFQYSLADYGNIRQAFEQVSLRFTVMNLPPAFLYSCVI